ncbi:MFS transporter [Microcoleus sp. C2C3]|uniref:MFS transporter n=1 Tax=unclassified Microcoleus TaxID=2642155 RepID=UPI002FCE823C
MRSLITLLGVPLMGLSVSSWGADRLLGYGIVLLVGVWAGMISLGCQYFMVDVNPQLYKKDAENDRLSDKKEKQITDFVPSALKYSNFLMFILYFSLWTFAVNLSAPFFNIYLLKNLSLDVSLVTIYSSLDSGANLLLLMFWGKLADRWGNRPLLIAVGLVVAVTPSLWLGTGNYPFAVWVWLPLLHLLGGTTLGAIGLCTNNIQMEIASIEQPSTYLAIATGFGSSWGFGNYRRRLSCRTSGHEFGNTVCPLGCCAVLRLAAFDFGARTSQLLAAVDRPHFWTFQI